MLCRTKSLLQDKTSHMTYNIQSECFISVQQHYAMIKLISDIGFRTSYVYIVTDGRAVYSVSRDPWSVNCIEKAHS